MRGWLLGQGIIVSSLVLPALGRWENGAIHSLFPRYHYVSLLGLAIMALPCAKAALEQPQKNLWTKVLAPGYLVSYLFVQFAFGHEFTYFVDVGSRNRAYFAEMAQWQTGRRETEPPLPTDTLPPGHTAQEFYRLANWLNADRYPLDSEKKKN